MSKKRKNQIPIHYVQHNIECKGRIFQCPFCNKMIFKDVNQEGDSVDPEEVVASPKCRHVVFSYMDSPEPHVFFTHSNYQNYLNVGKIMK